MFASLGPGRSEFAKTMVCLTQVQNAHTAALQTGDNILNTSLPDSLKIAFRSIRTGEFSNQSIGLRDDLTPRLDFNSHSTQNRLQLACGVSPK